MAEDKIKKMMSEEIPITPEQCRGARAMLGWSREDLAENAKVGVATLADFEAGKRQPYPRTLLDIRRALEAGGIAFVEGNGVRLAKHRGKAKSR